MTTEEFKKLKPEYKDLEGDQLWDAMTHYKLHQQQADQIIKQIMPVWKTHTLRWLYYRKKPNFSMGKISTDKYQSDKRCKACKLGVNTRMMFQFTAEDGTRSTISYCPHCGERYQEEPNTNISHRIYKVNKWITELFWHVLDSLHLVRSSYYGRYDIFGDESSYVLYWKYDMDWNPEKPILKKRIWWEYVLIEKRNIKF